MKGSRNATGEGRRKVVRTRIELKEIVSCLRMVFKYLILLPSMA